MISVNFVVGRFKEEKKKLLICLRSCNAEGVNIDNNILDDLNINGETLDVILSDLKNNKLIDFVNRNEISKTGFCNFNLTHVGTGLIDEYLMDRHYFRLKSSLMLRFMFIHDKIGNSGFSYSSMELFRRYYSDNTGIRNSLLIPLIEDRLVFEIDLEYSKNDKSRKAYALTKLGHIIAEKKYYLSLRKKDRELIKNFEDCSENDLELFIEYTKNKGNRDLLLQISKK